MGKRNVVLTTMSLFLLLVLILPASAAAWVPTSPLAPQDSQASDLPFDPSQVVLESRNSFLSILGGLGVNNGHLSANLNSWGLAFTPYMDGQARPEAQVGLHLSQVRLGTDVLYEASRDGGALPERMEEANRAGYRRSAGITEVYLALDFGVEQLFILSRPLQGTGDLVLTQELSTSLVPQPGEVEAEQVEFALAGGEKLTYGPSIVRDAAGREAPVAIWVGAGEARLTVAGEWLANATYPVIIDPLLGTGEINISNAGGSHQETPVVAVSDSDVTDEHRYLVVWADNRNGDWDIYGQFVKGNGDLHTLVLLVGNDDYNQLDPAIAFDGYNSKYVLTWEDTRNQTTQGVDVYFRTFDWEGVNFSTAVQVSQSTAQQDQFDPTVASTQNGWGMIAWTDCQQDGSGDIYARRVLITGSPSGNEFAVDSDGGVAETSPAIAQDTGGRYVIAYHDSGDIKIKAFDLSGNSVGTVHSLSPLTGTDKNPDIAYNAVDGKLEIVWERGDPDICQNSLIYGRWIKWNSSLPTPDYELAASTVLLSPSCAGTIMPSRTTPRVTYASSVNEYLVVWRVGTSGIEALQVSNAGDPVGSIWTVSPTVGDFWERSVPAAIYNPERADYLVVWQWKKFDDGAYQNDVYGRRMDTSQIVDPGTYDAFDPSVAYNSDDNEYLVVWVRYKGGNHEIVGRRISSTGSLLGTVDICTSSSSCTTTAVRRVPDVAYSSLYGGRYLVIWEVESSGNIRAREVYADGTTPRGAVDVCYSATDHQKPKLAFDPTGGRYLAVWEVNMSGDWDIYGAFITPQENNFPSVSCLTSAIASESGATEFSPDVAANPYAVDPSPGVLYRFFVVWERYDTQNIRGRFLSSGQNMGSIIDVIDTTATQAAPSVTLNAVQDPNNRRYLVVSCHKDSVYCFYDGAVVDETAGYISPAFAIHSSQANPPRIGVRDGIFHVLWQLRSPDGVKTRTVSPSGSQEEAARLIFGTEPVGLDYSAAIACGPGHCFIVRIVTGNAVVKGHAVCSKSPQFRPD